MIDNGLLSGLVPCWGMPAGAGEWPEPEELPELPEWWDEAPWPEAPSVDERGAWQLTDTELLLEAELAQRALAAAQARWLAALAEVEGREAAVRQLSMPTASWLAAGTAHSARVARNEVRVASGLQRTPHVASALASGAVSREQAEAILAGVERLPEELDAAQRDAVVEHLVALAADFGPTALRRLANRAVEVVAPEVAEEADRRALERAECTQARDRFVAWRRDDDGSLAFWGRLPAIEGELLVNQLTAVGKALRKADALAGVASLTRGQAFADALALVLAHHARCDGSVVGSGDWARVVVTLDLDALVGGTGVATLQGSGERVTAGQVRRLACQAGIIPAVLGGASQPLDVGRAQRLFTPAQKLALALRDGGCAFPGCDRPPGDCDAHHIVTWQSGGATDVGNGVLLCPHHHHLVEPNPTGPPEGQWLIDFDARGKPRFTTPAGRGGVRVTRQHARYLG